MVETINILIRTSRHLLQQLGREPTPEEIAAIMNKAYEQKNPVTQIGAETEQEGTSQEI